MGIDSKNPAEQAAAAEHAAKMERQKLSNAKTTGIKGNIGETRSDAEIRAQAENEIDAGKSVFDEPSIYDEASIYSRLPPAESGFWRNETEAESVHSEAINENIKSFISFLKKGKYDHADELKEKVTAMVTEHPPTDAPDSDAYGEYIRNLIFQADKELAEHATT